MATRFNTVVIGGKRITIRPNAADRPGRTVAYRSLPAEATAGTDHLHRTDPPDKNAGALAGSVPKRGTPSDGTPPLIGNVYPNVAPKSRRIIDHGQISGRLKAGGALPGYPTPLDTGLPPQHIRRRTQAADRGAVGPGTNTGITGPLGFNDQSNGGSLTIPHVRIPRTPITVTTFRRTIDMTSSIPARGIGAPVK